MNLEILEFDGKTFYVGPIPNERDRGVEALVSSALESSQIEEMVEQLHPRHYAILVMFGERMASLAMRREDPGLLRVGLTAVALGGLNHGSREAIMRLVLYHHAAEALSGSAEGLFHEVGRTLGQPFQGHLEAFPARAGEDKTLECMGYLEGSDEDGFRYKRNW